MSILNIDSTEVTITDVFDTKNKYLYQKQLNIPLNQTYTKLANPPSATIGRYPATFATDDNGNSVPIGAEEYLEYRPFVYNHGWTFSDPFPNVSLLLIDRAPLLEGPHNFTCGGVKFQGLIKQLTPYAAWSYTGGDWVNIGILGYAIEVSKTNSALTTLTGGSAISGPPGVLFDERSDNIILSEDILLWPQYGTISAYRNQLTYSYTTEKYVLNGELPTDPVYVGLGIN